MADCFWGSIEIGGSLPRSKVKDLLSHIENDIGDELTEDFLEEHMDETLSFEDDQARQGEFEETETFCKDNGLSFVRQSSACGEYNAETAWHVEGYEEGWAYADNNGNEVCPLNTITSIIEAVDAVAADPEKAPLFINDDKGDKKKVADLILKGTTDKYELFKEMLANKFPSTPDVPLFIILEDV